MNTPNKTKLNPWFFTIFADNIVCKESDPIDVWAEKNVMLPSNTSEPGRYSADRAEYQRQIMKDMSPDSPVQRVILCWGSQTGKTTCENNIMLYYIVEQPVPQAFGFSDDANLKNYVKNKFNPTLEANPKVKQALQAVGGRGSGNTMTTKTYNGGFIKFLSGKSGASLRSDSVMVFIADELDAWGITKDGDPHALILKRTNTYGARRKICESSTPLNVSIIHEYLKASTNNHFYMPCPHCGYSVEFTMEQFRWTLEGVTITDAWMECPNCNGKIHNEDKIDMLPKGKWMSTNPNANTLNQGYYLPSFYAPVGWLSFKDIAQEYYEACLTDNGSDYDKMTAFCNTVLAIPYVVGSETNDWRILYEKNMKSEYLRGQIPEWVNIITTGSDVQGNRIETTIMGWGLRGRRIAIDHIQFLLGKDEEMTNLDNNAWTEYREIILNGVFEREDGLKMKSLANAIDRSYLPDTVAEFYISLEGQEKENCFPVRGYEKLTGVIPVQKFVHKEGLSEARYWDVPVNSLKRQVYDHLRITDNPEGTVAFVPFYPNDYNQEFYMQLFSEYEVKKGNRLVWEKSRDRNEILDTHVYNYAMFYMLGLGGWTNEDWLGYAEMLKAQLTRTQNRTRTRRVSQISSGISL